MQLSFLDLENRYEQLSKPRDPLEYQVRDRLSFMRLLGLDLAEVLQPPEVGGTDVYADSAYRSQVREESLTATGHTSRIREKGTCNHPLTDAQRSGSKEKSRVRARVEHVFGSMTNELGGIAIRTVGFMRAKVQIGLLNLVYNIERVVTLIRKKHFGFDRVTAVGVA